MTMVSLLLSNRVKIPKENIREVLYGQGAGDGSDFQKWISKQFGTNVTVENTFDSKHRMKLRMYSQDYLIYSVIGMTVRMQHKRLGIWWRKKAEEFRYGWSEIEVVHKYKKFPFQDPPKMPDGLPRYAKFPIIIQPFPYTKTNIILFHVANYDFKTGDLNKVFKAGVKSVAGLMKDWSSDENNATYKDEMTSIYATREKESTVHVLYPQGEEVANNEGRDVVQWDLTGMNGNIKICRKDLKFLAKGWSVCDFSVGSVTETSIARGRIYAAVKYNGQWRVCVIKTD